MIYADNQMPSEEENEAVDTLKFSFHMALKPEVSFPALENISLEYPEILVSEERMNSFIADMQKRYGEVRESDFIAEGDLIKGVLKSADGTFETETDFPFSRIKPGYQSQFLGKKVSETMEFPIEEAFADEEIRFVINSYRDKDNSREFKGLFTLEITKISTTVAAELDEKLFEKVLGNPDVETEEEFRKGVRAMFEDTYREESEALFRMKLEKFLLDQSALELPEDIISKIILERAGEKHSSEEMQSFIPQYLVSLRMSLIREAIANAHQIRISREDVVEQAKEKVSAELRQMGMAHLGDDFLMRFVDHFLNDKEKRNEEQMAEKALTAKIASIVTEKGKIVRKSVGIDEFNKMVEELN
jgi:trigger factor